MKNLVIVVSSLIILSSCKVEKEEKGALPEIDVDVQTEAGKLPEYDVDWADVSVGTQTRTVKIPKVVVVMEEEEVEVPFITVDMPGESKKERTITVEAEVSGKEQEIEIMEIRASSKRLYVLSKIDELDTDLGDKTLRIQDQVDLSAPDLDVKHIIVGKKADRVFNNNFEYVSSMGQLDDKVKEAKVIYTK